MQRQRGVGAVRRGAGRAARAGLLAAVILGVSFSGETAAHAASVAFAPETVSVAETNADATLNLAVPRPVRCSTWA